MKAFALLALAACGGWSRHDTILEAAYIASASLDEAQTQATTAACNESNPLIGTCGCGRVGGYFFLTDLGHLFVSLALPPTARTAWQGFTIGVETTTVARNYADGVNFWP